MLKLENICGQFFDFFLFSLLPPSSCVCYYKERKEINWFIVNNPSLNKPVNLNEFVTDFSPSTERFFITTMFMKRKFYAFYLQFD